ALRAGHAARDPRPRLRLRVERSRDPAAWRPAPAVPRADRRMTAFLASLAARSTGLERVLEPRRLLFEPHDGPPPEAAATAPPPRPGAAPLPAGDRAATPAERSTAGAPLVRAMETRRPAAARVDPDPPTPALRQREPEQPAP